MSLLSLPSFAEMRARHPRMQRKYDESQPRDEHGRFSSGLSGDDLRALTNDARAARDPRLDGLGVDPVTGVIMRDGDTAERLQHIALQDAIGGWAGDTNWVDRVQDAADAMVQGIDPNTVEGGNGMEQMQLDARAMLKAIDQAEPNAPQLWRGIVADSSPDYEIGKSIDFALGSFTENQSWAQEFALGMTSPLSTVTEGTPVLFKLEPGARGIDVTSVIGGPAPNGLDEDEWVTGGRFDVTDVKDTTLTDDGTGHAGLIVTLKQTDTPHAA